MKAIENTDPVVGYIPNHPSVDSLTLVLRSGGKVVIPFDPLSSVTMNSPHDGVVTLALRSGRMLTKDITDFKSESIVWFPAGHRGRGDIKVLP